MIKETTGTISTSRPHVVLYQPSADGPRAPWGDTSRPTKTLFLQADSVADALAQASRGLVPLDHSIVAVEEGSPGLTFPDDALTAALSSMSEHENLPLMDPENYAPDGPVYSSDNFLHTVELVANSLRNSGLVPGLSISPVQTDDYNQYVMVEMYVENNKYRATGCELKDLTDDRSAEGWDGVLAIARALLEAASEVA